MSAPGWHRDPAGAPALRWWDGQAWTGYTAPLPHRDPRPPLDRHMAELRARDPRPWGARPVVFPIVAYVVAILVGSAAAAAIDPGSRVGKLAFATTANVALDAIVVAGAILAGREIAARYGGWGAAFGLLRPRWKDVAIALGGFGVIMVARVVLGIVIVAAGGADQLREAQNLKGNGGHIDPAVVALLVVVAVIAAPVIEEFVFRGLLLRTFMQRWSFWPAALVSSLIFAVGHTYEVNTLAGAAILAANVGIIGVVHCCLVRYTGRLSPAMMSHALVNGLAVLVLASGLAST
jgi:membrane protease YdiL (CAAX protease family)